MRVWNLLTHSLKFIVCQCQLQVCEVWALSAAMYKYYSPIAGPPIRGGNPDKCRGGAHEKNFFLFFFIFFSSFTCDFFKFEIPAELTVVRYCRIKMSDNWKTSTGWESLGALTENLSGGPWNLWAGLPTDTVQMQIISEAHCNPNESTVMMDGSFVVLFHFLFELWDPSFQRKMSGSTCKVPLWVCASKCVKKQFTLTKKFTIFIISYFLSHLKFWNRSSQS
jgi:hypothetical protein